MIYQESITNFPFKVLTVSNGSVRPNYMFAQGPFARGRFALKGGQYTHRIKRHIRTQP